MKRILFFFFASSVIFSCTEETKQPAVAIPAASTNAVPNINYSVVATFPHDTSNFTQGLIVYNGQLFESTGSPEEIPYARTIFGPVDWKTGKIEVKGELDRKTFFGEGITILKNKLYQLTYKNQIGFIYDVPSFKKTGQFTYRNEEGWGLTNDGTNLIMSDGTDKLTYIDPATLKPVKTLSVSENGYAADYLNELEYIKGFIYANVWRKNFIVKIDPATGKIAGKLNLVSQSYEARNKHARSEVLNGIAYDPAADKIFVTGKLWPAIYQISFIH